jgi:hypothetical protein
MSRKDNIIVMKGGRGGRRPFCVKKMFEEWRKVMLSRFNCRNEANSE